jgi:hypothetical protein
LGTSKDGRRTLHREPYRRRLPSSSGGRRNVRTGSGRHIPVRCKAHNEVCSHRSSVSSFVPSLTAVKHFQIRPRSRSRARLSCAIAPSPTDGAANTFGAIDVFGRKAMLGKRLRVVTRGPRGPAPEALARRPKPLQACAQPSWLRWRIRQDIVGIGAKLLPLTGRA